MEITTILLSFMLGIYSGILFYKWCEKYKNKRSIKDLNIQFQELLDGLSKSSFKNRINDTIYINSKLKEYGDITVIYLLDKEDIGIMKGNTCVLTSHSVDKKLIKDIIDSINHIYKKEINDVVNVLGFTFSKDEFEKTYGIKVEDLKRGQIKKSEIEKIKTENEIKFNIDDILDKINKVGIENLTAEENNFLKNLNK